MAVGPPEAEPFWTILLKGLLRRGLRGVKLVVSDAHAGEGLKAAIRRVLGAIWQRCRVPKNGVESAEQPAHAGDEGDPLRLAADETSRS